MIFPNEFLIKLSFRELQVGVPVSDDNGVVYGNSVTAAQQGIAQVTMSRIFMACPGNLCSMLGIKLSKINIWMRIQLVRERSQIRNFDPVSERSLTN